MGSQPKGSVPFEVNHSTKWMNKHLVVIVCWVTRIENLATPIFSIAIIALPRPLKFCCCSCCCCYCCCCSHCCFYLGFPVTHVPLNGSHPARPELWNILSQFTHLHHSLGFTSLAVSLDLHPGYWLRYAPSLRRSRMGRSFLPTSMCSLATSPELPKSSIPRW